jgi:lysophospholipase L1-like esterase
MGQEIHENILENHTYVERSVYFKQNPLKEGQIVFLGNSLTQGGKWNEYFPEQNPVNRGISGDNTLGMLGRLHEVIEGRPMKLFIMAGINDISLNRPNDMIINGIKSIIYQVKEGSPDTRIYVQSILPINKDVCKYKRMMGKEKKIEELNKLIRKFCESENITFINLYPHFLGGKRLMDAKYTSDGLHLNEEGYAVWVSRIEDYVNNHGKV